MENASEIIEACTKLILIQLRNGWAIRVNQLKSVGTMLEIIGKQAKRSWTNVVKQLLETSCKTV